MNCLSPPTLTLDDLSDSESDAGASAGVEHSEIEQLDGLELGSSTFSRFNGYLDSAGDADSFNGLIVVLGDVDCNSYPDLEVSELTCEFGSSISIDGVDVAVTEDVSYSTPEG